MFQCFFCRWLWYYGWNERTLRDWLRRSTHDKKVLFQFQSLINWKSLKGGTVPPFSTHFGGSIPPFSTHLGGTFVYSGKRLFTRTLFWSISSYWPELFRSITFYWPEPLQDPPVSFQDPSRTLMEPLWKVRLGFRGSTSQEAIACVRG